MGRMVVLAEADRAHDRLTAAQIDAIVEGTDEVLDFLADDADDGELAAPAAAADPTARELRAVFRCVGGRARSTMPRPRSSPLPCASTASRQERPPRRHRRGRPEAKDRSTFPLICYASHPSDAVRRYNPRKLRGGGAGRARHAVIDYDVAPGPSPAVSGAAGPRDTLTGDIATICRLAAQHAVTVGWSLGSVTAS